MGIGEEIRKKPLDANSPEFWIAFQRFHGNDKGVIRKYQILVNKISKGSALVEEISSNLGKELIERCQARMLHHLDRITTPDTPAEEIVKSQNHYAAYENVLGDIDEIVKTYTKAVTSKAELDAEGNKEES